MKLSMFAAIFALATAGVVAGATSSKADVTYFVTGTFDDSTPLSGEFTVDVYGYVISWDLTTFDGTISAYTYTGATSFPDGCLPTNCVSYGRLSPPYLGGLQLTFMNPLGSDAPDPIIGGPLGPSWENYSYTIGGEPIRYIASGVATPVPEATTWAMLLLGFAGLGFAGYRRSGRTGAATA